MIESVWEYPRPPRLEPAGQRIRVVHSGVTVVDTEQALRVLETSHPPVYYVPRVEIAAGLVTASASRGSFCEFKGVARYWDLTIGDETVRDAAWSYERPSAAFAGLAGYLAFYASRVDQCWVGEERVVPQDGDFYGGWITSNLRGPFKGAPETRGW